MWIRIQLNISWIRIINQIHINIKIIILTQRICINMMFFIPLFIPFILILIFGGLNQNILFQIRNNILKFISWYIFLLAILLLITPTNRCFIHLVFIFHFILAGVLFIINSGHLIFRCCKKRILGSWWKWVLETLEFWNRLLGTK